MKVGDTIAGYDIVARLKAGGMAALYLGKRHGAAGFAKHVAIKVVHEHLADDENFIRMFLDEARITARIEHPNVVHVHDLGQADGHYFLVMEYVPSVALTQLLRAVAKLRRRLSPEVATWIAMQIAAGLHAAHETTDDEGNPLGIVHRDVSPKNILLAYKGYVKVIDFGIAKAAGRATKTQGGLLKGTFRYMSPEQARGKPLDARSDLYALGICLWEMLVLRRLFDADSDLALLDMVRDPKIVPPGKLVGGIPPELDRVLMKALSREPEDRQANCDELRAELARAVPEALRVTPRQVAELIGATMAGQASADVEPSVASAIGRPVTVQVPQAVIEKLTRSPDEGPLIAGSAALQTQPLVVTPTGSQQEPSSGVVVRDPPSTVTPTPSAGGALEPAPSMGSSSKFAPPAPQGKARRSGALVAALVAVPLLIGVGVVVAMTMRASGGPVVEPLPPRDEAEPEGVEILPLPATAQAGEAQDVAEPAPAEAADEPEAAVPSPPPSEAADEPSAAPSLPSDEPVPPVESEVPSMRARATRRTRPRREAASAMEETSARMRRRRTTATDDPLLVDDW